MSHIREEKHQTLFNLVHQARRVDLIATRVIARPQLDEPTAQRIRDEAIATMRAPRPAVSTRHRGLLGNSRSARLLTALIG